jgi:hypothetical protein
MGHRRGFASHDLGGDVRSAAGVGSSGVRPAQTDLRPPVEAGPDREGLIQVDRDLVHGPPVAVLVPGLQHRVAPPAVGQHEHSGRLSVRPRPHGGRGAVLRSPRRCLLRLVDVPHGDAPPFVS